MQTFSRKTPYFIWKTKFPAISPVFKFLGNLWRIKAQEVVNEVDNEVQPSFFLERLHNSFHEEFQIGIFLFRNRLIHLSDTAVVSYDKRKNKIRIFCDENFECNVKESTQYIFMFDTFLDSISDGKFEQETEHHFDWSLLARDKSIQTPTYMDSQPCLESLSEDLRKLMEDISANPDVQLHCESCTVPAHRNILSSRSDVFRAMLQTDMMESRSGYIELADMSITVLKEFLKYIYSGTLPDISLDLALQLYEIGDKYAVSALRKRCRDFLMENLTPENACRFLGLADSHSDKNFKEYIISFILNNEIPLKSEDWPSFCSSHPVLAVEILNQGYRIAKSNNNNKSN